jgi:hypothetical protein
MRFALTAHVLASASQRPRPSLRMKIKNRATPLGAQGARCCLKTRANSSRKVGPARSPHNRTAHPPKARKAVRRPPCSPRLAGRQRPSLILIPSPLNGEARGCQRPREIGNDAEGPLAICEKSPQPPGRPRGSLRKWRSRRRPPTGLRPCETLCGGKRLRSPTKTV